jgi:hypothetical protein
MTGPFTAYIDQAIAKLPDRTIRERRPALPPPALMTPALPYRTALEIAHSTTERPEWIVPGYAARQAITELGGKIKAAGKTTWVTHLVASVLHGLPFLGVQTVESNVVYLTEQSRGSFREALRRADLLDRGDELRVIFRREVAHLPWPDLMAQVARDALGDGYGLIVVDTLGKLAGIREENDAGSAAAAMVPLQDAAHDGLGVIVCRHERKGGGEVGEAARGSSAFGGDVDIILSLRRPEGNQRPTLRELHSLSRYDETPDRMLIDLTEDGYALLGDVDSVAIAEAIRIVSDHLGEQFDLNESGLSVDELTELSELARSTVQRALRQMEREDRITVSGRGVRGNPRKFTLERREIDSDQTHLSSDWNESNGIGGRDL